MLNYYDDCNYEHFMGFSRNRLARIKRFLVNHEEVYKYVNWATVDMFGVDKAREVLQKGNGTFVVCGDRQVTNWGLGVYELENWENNSYEYDETENIDEAIMFLEGGLVA